MHIALSDLSLTDRSQRGGQEQAQRTSGLASAAEMSNTPVPSPTKGKGSAKGKGKGREVNEVTHEGAEENEDDVPIVVDKQVTVCDTCKKRGEVCQWPDIGSKRQVCQSCANAQKPCTIDGRHVSKYTRKKSKQDKEVTKQAGGSWEKMSKELDLELQSLVNTFPRLTIMTHDMNHSLD